MSDVLDIDDGGEDFQIDEEGDQSVLKRAVCRECILKKIKGRGREVIEGWLLYIAGVHKEAKENDIYEKFSEHGDIKSIQLIRDPQTELLTGDALVEYGTYEEALSALGDLDGTDMLGQQIKVELACLRRSIKKRRGHHNRTLDRRRHR